MAVRHDARRRRPMLEKHHGVRILDEARRARRSGSRTATSRPPAARQGGQPARHRLRPRRASARAAIPPAHRGRRRAASTRSRRGDGDPRARGATASATSERDGRDRGELEAQRAELAQRSRPTASSRQRWRRGARSSCDAILTKLREQIADATEDGRGRPTTQPATLGRARRAGAAPSSRARSR